jgi:hypothetical protein
MFSTAVSLASQFTRPVVISVRRYDGSLESGIASFVVINRDGWIVTAAHVLQVGIDAPNHAAEIAAYESAKNSRAKGGPKRNPKWITIFSYWWALDGVNISNFTYSRALDLAIGKLEPFDPSLVTNYPVFRDASHPLQQGTSLCKLGFPFHEFSPTFDPATGVFTLPPGALPAPRFPIEGILTREVIGNSTPDGLTQKFIETSSPGLRGQSGGPVFDTAATVYGIQSHTNHLALGFNAQVVINGRKVEEQQFLNVGRAVHPETVSSFLVKNGVDHIVA